MCHLSTTKASGARPRAMSTAMVLCSWNSFRGRSRSIQTSLETIILWVG
uniref:BRL1 n=1 Tax=Arundo donax TaxID=35708 RepID=A0A0A9R5N2_ARUDO